MADDADPHDASLTSWLQALAHVGLFLLSSLLWMVGLGITAGVVIAISHPEALAHGVDLMAYFDGFSMGILTILQIGGLAVLGMLLATLMQWRAPGASDPGGWWSLPESSQLGPRVRQHLALRSSSRVWLAVGLLGGLTVWTLPTAVASWLVEQLQLDSLSLELTARMLLEGSPLERATMALAVTVSAPIFEEVIFRGYLWEVSERCGGRWFALLFTTVLFAAYHMDPVHSLSLLPTAAFLGGLRLASGSLWPSMLAHFANNGIAMVITLAISGEAEGDLPWWIAVGGTGLTLLFFVLGLLYNRSRPPPSGAPS